MDLRSSFPVLKRVAYLNAGTNGPIPGPAIDAAQQRLDGELDYGRSGERHWESLKALHANRRTALAGLLGCDEGEVALTHSTTDGVNVVVSALGLREGDEVVTTDEEHPGLLAPLASARDHRGIKITIAPFDRIADAVSERTKLIACSHVSWMNGNVIDTAALRETGVSVLLDGAQGLGAIPVDVRELGCDYYAASGQKWLCGPDGTGCLYVKADRLEQMTPPSLGFQDLEDPHDPLELKLYGDARRFDEGFVTGFSAAWSLSSIELLAAYGWENVHSGAAGLAATLAERLAERGLDVMPRGNTTLVAWRDDDCEGCVKRLDANGVVVRYLPGAGLVRAAVGAWNSEDDIERLLGLL